MWEHSAAIGPPGSTRGISVERRSREAFARSRVTSCMPARTLAGFAAAVAAIVIAVAAYFLVVADRNRNGTRVTERSETVRTLQRLENALVRVENAQRGYLLTHEEPLLEAYRQAVADVHAELDGVKTRVSPRSRDGLAADPLASLVAAKLAELRRGIEVRNADGLATALRELRSGDGSWLTETIEAVRAEMEAIERAEAGEERRAGWGRVAMRCAKARCPSSARRSSPASARSMATISARTA